MIARLKEWFVRKLGIEPINAKFNQVIRALFHIPEAPTKKVENKSLAKWTGKIHCIDCIELMKSLPAESISVIVTSPPYNIKKGLALQLEITAQNSE